MIYLVTGGMGVGKTAFVVDMILSNKDGLFKTTADDGAEIDRPLYFCRIDGLKADKLKAHELTKDQIQEKPLEEIVPIGSVVIVDECDYVYPRRSPNSAPPPYVQTLKELRHHGLTLILMTQHPTMLDVYLRNLVSFHIHFERKQVGTKKYEFYSAQPNLTPDVFKNAVSSYYTPPERAFDYYKSSSKHIPFKKKRHPYFLLIPVVLCAAVYYGYPAYKRFLSDSPPPEQVSESVESFSASAVDSAFVPPVPPVGAVASAPLGSLASHYEPAIPSLPETKPIYDNLRNPVNMETISGCVATRDSCNCYTDQATKVYVNEHLCRDYAANGVFQIYKQLDVPK